MTYNPFDRSGLASLDDLSTPQWRACFPHLESIQREFLAAKPHSADYPWPGDPLHNCIRVWEYPFVYHHLQAFRCTLPERPLPLVVDLGSGCDLLSVRSRSVRLGGRCRRCRFQGYLIC